VGRHLAAQVLQGARADDLAAVALDERPPRVAELGPARLDAGDHGLRLLARLGLAGDVAHDLGVGVERVQAVQVRRRAGVEAQAGGREDGHRGRRGSGEWGSIDRAARTAGAGRQAAASISPDAGPLARKREKRRALPSVPLIL